MFYSLIFHYDFAPVTIDHFFTLGFQCRSNSALSFPFLESSLGFNFLNLMVNLIAFSLILQAEDYGDSQDLLVTAPMVTGSLIREQPQIRGVTLQIPVPR